MKSRINGIVPRLQKRAIKFIPSSTGAEEPGDHAIARAPMNTAFIKVGGQHCDEFLLAARPYKSQHCASTKWRSEYCLKLADAQCCPKVSGESSVLLPILEHYQTCRH